MSDLENLCPETLVVSAGRQSAPGSPLNVPIIPATNFVLGGERGYVRANGTESWEAFEAIIGGLEGGHAVAFSSGMSAIAAVFDLLPAQSMVAIPSDCYQGVGSLADAGRDNRGWNVERIEVTNTAEWQRVAKEADLVWLESPSNPLLELADLETICRTDRKPGSIMAVDNTFATPLNQTPLSLGADIAVHSATKFIGGHSDLLAGVTVTTDQELLDGMRRSRLLAGTCPGALETFLAIRGVRTMALRLRKAEANAGMLAEHLEQHPSVSLVRYPGLRSHEGHELARTQLRGFGTMISFDVAGGAAQADAVCARLQLIQHATSLGAVESTMERRAAVPGQEHLPPNLLRLSVGIEAPMDLWADLQRALEA